MTYVMAISKKTGTDSKSMGNLLMLQANARTFSRVEQRSLFGSQCQSDLRLVSLFSVLNMVSKRSVITGNGVNAGLELDMAKEGVY